MQLPAELDGVALEVLAASSLTSSSETYVPWARMMCEVPGMRKSISPLPSRRSAPSLVEHDARIATAGHLERDPRRQVPLDQAGDDVHGGLLRRQDQVDAHGTGELRQPDDVVLGFLLRRHHHLGELVHHDDDVRHAGRDSLAFRLVLGGQPRVDLLRGQLVEGVDVPDLGTAEELVRARPSSRRPRPAATRPFSCQRPTGCIRWGIRLNWESSTFLGSMRIILTSSGVRVMRIERIIALRQTDLPVPVRPAMSKWGISARSKTRADPWHPCPGTGGCGSPEAPLHPGHHVAESDHVPVVVGHLDADGRPAGDRRHDADARHGQGNRQVVGQADDPRHAQAGLQLDLELGDDRAGIDLHDADLVAEIKERPLQEHRAGVDSCSSCSWIGKAAGGSRRSIGGS